MNTAATVLCARFAIHAAFVGEVLRATFFFPWREGTFPPVCFSFVGNGMPYTCSRAQLAMGKRHANLPVLKRETNSCLGRNRPHWYRLLNISHCALHNLLKWGCSQRIARRRRCQVEQWRYRQLAVSRKTVVEVLATLLHPRKLTLFELQRVTVKVLTTGL